MATQRAHWGSRVGFILAAAGSAVGGFGVPLKGTPGEVGQPEGWHLVTIPEIVQPVFRLGELYLWDTPFSYGIHRHPNIYVPYYVGPESPGRTSPYDPGYYYYPYTPYWIRPQNR